MVRNSFLSVLICFVGLPFAFAQSAPEQTEFFEQHIRPVLVEKCYKCHNSIDNDEAGLAVDFREGIRSETEHGQVVVPNKPDESVLLKVIRHEIDDLEMPEDSGKLDEETIANFERWIAMGAADPRDDPPTKEELEKATSWESTLAKRKKWWSLQPVQSMDPPTIEGVKHPVDRFLAEKHKEVGLKPAEKADRQTLIRRLSYVLLGLPPTAEQVQAFVNDKRDDAYETIVDDMLSSDRFGERWARHWMDVVRYADSHGSEGDPAIPEIYRYRDYLIRAFNQDVPYDQLLREHVAGDLIDNPRINEELGINESLIGPAHWRLVFHGFAPTDALDEKVRFTDDQINVFSKAFLGMTVSCARCHDHKFDAISQADYYALFGVLASCRPTLRDINVMDKQVQHKQELSDLKNEIRVAVADHWQNDLSSVKEKLLADGEWKEKRSKHKNPNQLFYLLSEIERRTTEKDVTVESTWKQLRTDWKQHQAKVTEDRAHENRWHWDLTNAEDYESWFRDGNGLPDAPSKAGDFRIDSADRAIAAILPSGVHANTLSSKHRAFLSSPRFNLDGEYKLWFELTGGGQSMSRYSVEHYPRNGTVYPIRDINNNRWFLQEYNLKYWNGDYVHLEVNTARDAPLQTRGAERSWFSVREVFVRGVDDPKPVSNDRQFVAPLFATETDPTSAEEVANAYVATIEEALEAWKSDSISDAQSNLLHECILEGLLNNEVETLGTAKNLVEKYRKLENDIPTPTRVPGLQEADIFDQPLLERGDHRKPSDAIPRRFLEAINPEPFEAKQSGRLELADNLVAPDNPLVSRVMVNRIWHYVFGQGIVATPDNFGQLGERPSHSKLLDYLATRFTKGGWSIKDTVRLLVTSESFQRASTASDKATDIDPTNRLLSHANVRRLDAESIRDTLIFVSGQMDDAMYGPGFNANGDTPRRAIYVRSRRNSMDQFLETFNSPIPFSTTGRRSQTNVPAQSLTMLNSPFVMETARVWSRNNKQLDASKRIAEMFETAIGRQPTSEEETAFAEYAGQLQQQAIEFESKAKELTAKLETNRKQLADMITPVREKLLQEKSNGKKTESLAPIAAWDFENGLSDSIGDLNGTLKGNAKLQDAALVVDGGFLATPPIDRDLGEKTLVATVQLSNLQQQGGGAMTIQTLGGGVFDSIVFAERKKGHWMAGSDGFRRTDDFNGEQEKQAKEEPVHMAIAYDADGTIRGYRNGKTYGKPIRKSGLNKYKKGEAHVVLGIRHGEAADSRSLKGRIFAAQLFDRALSSDEILALSKGGVFVSDKEVLGQLSEADREKVFALRKETANLENQRDNLGEPISQDELWARVGHALFNSKELIYLK